VGIALFSFLSSGILARVTFRDRCVLQKMTTYKHRGKVFFMIASLLERLEQLEREPIDLSVLTDEEVLARSQRDPEAFSELLTRYEAPFRRKARAIVRSKEDAEEVVQIAFVKIYQYADRFSPQESASFRSWAYRILINCACTRYQKIKRELLARADIDHEVFALLPDRDLRQFERAEVRDLVIRALAELPDVFARTLDAYFLQGHSQKEIADAEGASVGAIKTRMHRAKREFRTVAARLSLR